MYKRIILAVDLADEGPAPKGLPQALEIVNAGGGALRLVNIQPVIPATFMEYVPADFDEDQAKRATETLEDHRQGDRPAAGAQERDRAGGRHLSRNFARRPNGPPISLSSARIGPSMADYLLGSNAKTIVRHALCSVLVVRE